MNGRDYQVIQDIGGVFDSRNQITASRPYIAQYQTPPDMKNLRQVRSQPSPELMETSGMAEPTFPQQQLQPLQHQLQPQHLPSESRIQTHPDYLVDDGINCKQVHLHLENCPFCSKFYKKDRNMYLLVIFMLIIIIIILLKKK
jgi:hypothetical protein